MSSIILYEVYKRIKKINGEQAAIIAYAHIIANSTVVPLGKKIALEAADISIGEGLGMADAIIMATARMCGARIVTSDIHFKGKENVIFIE